MPRLVLSPGRCRGKPGLRPDGESQQETLTLMSAISGAEGATVQRCGLNLGKPDPGSTPSLMTAPRARTILAQTA